MMINLKIKNVNIIFTTLIIFIGGSKKSLFSYADIYGKKNRKSDMTAAVLQKVLKIFPKAIDKVSGLWYYSRVDDVHVPEWRNWQTPRT